MPEQLSPAEKWAAEREAKINYAISLSPELIAFFESLKNQFFDVKAIDNFVKQWNSSHSEFLKDELNFSVQKTYEAKGNATITIWASSSGKVRLMANF